MTKLYTAIAISQGGRGGHVRTSDGVLDLQIRSPKEMGGPMGSFTNPEQLFACGYAACFNSAMLAVAKEKKAVLDSHVEVRVTFNQDDKGGYFLSVEMYVNIPDVSKEEAEEVVAHAHHVCPYSKAIRNNVEVDFFVTNHKL